MSDGKRNKKYSNKKDNKKSITLLAKRDGPSKEDKASRKTQSEEKPQPKILLKVKEKEPTPAPIVIATREPPPDASSSQSPSNISLQSKEKEATPAPTTTETVIKPIPKMTRSVALISNANYIVNQNTLKLFMKSNTDFFVVGIIGTQGVGKSTIMNLLACDEHYADVYSYFFRDKEGIFPAKCKTGMSCPNTESVQMFITKDRMILLDCPPVLCNSYRKDATSNELEDIRLLIFLLTACHLVIVVQDDYFNLNLLRLIQFAELAKPIHDNKSFVADYFPNVMFVRNNAKRIDFLADERIKKEAMLKHFFKRSQLKILVGQSDKMKKGKQADSEKTVNYFLLPEVKGDALNAYHPSLDLLVMDFRNRVFMSPRNQIYNGNTEFTEALWFELIHSTTINKTNFFLTTYEEIRKHHLHGGEQQGPATTKATVLSYVDSTD